MNRRGTAGSSPSSHSVTTTQLAARPVLEADVDDVAVAHVDRAALRRGAGRRLARHVAGRPRARDARGDLGARVERAAHALAVALGRVVGDRDQHRLSGQSRRSSPTVSRSGRSGDRADGHQHARHEARAVGRDVADRERLGDVAEDHVLVGDDARAAGRSGSARRPPSARRSAWPCPTARRAWRDGGTR